MGTNDAQELPALAGMVKVNAEEFTRTITGFDELAVEKAFRTPLDELPGVRAIRALLFVRLRREGAKDADAFKAAMGVTLGRLEDLFAKPDDDEDQEDEPGEG